MGAHPANEPARSRPGAGPAGTTSGAPAPEFDPPLQACPLCAARTLTPYDHDFRGCTIDRCGACGVLLMNPQYSDAHLARFYAGYVSLHDQDRADHPRYSIRNADVRREGKRRSLRLVAEHCGVGRLLSVGCGDGLELGVAAALGWQVEGYDIDPATTARVAERFGVPVHSGPFPAIPVADGSFDAVFMDQVLEHLKQPRPYLATAHRVLRPGGILFLGLPNIGSLANRFKTMTDRLGLRRRRRGNHYATKHHLVYYSPGVLRRVLEREGFAVVLVRGSLKPQRNPITPRLSRWLPVVDSGFLVLARKR